MARSGQAGGFRLRRGGAPLAIAVVMDQAKMPQLEAALAVQQMALAAWADGGGIGYPTPAEVTRKKRRKPLNPVAHRERFGESYGAA